MATTTPNPLTAIKTHLRDLASRASKTFLQTLAALVTLDTFNAFSLAEWKAAASAAVAATYSVVQNTIRNWRLEREALKLAEAWLAEHGFSTPE